MPVSYTHLTYKKFLGYRPGVAVIDDLIVGIENSDGNTNVRDVYKRQELYRNDLIEFVSYYVAAKAENFYKQALKDDLENRVLAAQRNLQQTVDLLMDVDRLLASHPLYRLEEWVELARNSGTDVYKRQPPVTAYVSVTSRHVANS